MDTRRSLKCLSNDDDSHNGNINNNRPTVFDTFHAVDNITKQLS